MAFVFNPITGKLDKVTQIGDPTGGTWGSVLFVDSSGNLKQDNTGSPNYYGITAFNNTSDPANSSLRVGNAAGGGYLYVGQATIEGSNPVSLVGNGQVNSNSGGLYYFDFIEEGFKRLADYNYSTETFYFGPHSSQTSTTQTELGTISVIKDDGTVTHYKPSTDSNANRGAALVTAMSAAAAGDTVRIGAGTYQINSTLTPLDNMSIIGIGNPIIVTNAFSDGTPAITLQNDNITIQGITVQSNTTCLGLHSATPTTISNLIIRDVVATVTDTDANALMFSQSHGGGNTEHLVTANIYNSRFIGGTSAGFGSYASLQTGSLMNFYDCHIYGATDGYLHKNSSGTSTGVTNIFGGQAYSVLDAVTSGGTGNVINCYGVYASGDQADFYGDDGTVNIYWCIAAHGSSYIVGNGINRAIINTAIGDIETVDGDILFTSFGGSPDAGVQRVGAAQLKITDGSTGIGGLRFAPRVGSTTSSATPTINTDNVDAYSITALATAITSFTTNLSGTPSNFQKLTIRIKDNGTARAITWGSSFQAMGAALPTTTVISKVLTVGFIYDTVAAKWGCVASAQEA